MRATRRLRCALLRECADLLDVELHLPLETLGHVRPDDSEAVHDQGRSERELRELVAHPQLSELLGIATNEDEAVEIAAVRLEEDGLEAVERIPVVGRDRLREIRRVLLKLAKLPVEFFAGGS